MKLILRSSATRFAIFIMAVFFGNSLRAQTISYSFTYFMDEAYNDLTGDSIVTDPVWGAWGAGGFAGFNVEDIEIPLGFNFQLFEQTTNKLFVMRDATSLSGLREPDTLGSTDLYNILSPFSIPAFDRAWAPHLHHFPGVLYDSTHPGYAPLSPISVKTYGTAPNRITKIQYKNVGFVADTSGNSFINYQVWLYEQDNIIEFRYGPQFIHPSIFAPSIYNDSGLATGPVVSLTNDVMWGSCASPRRTFEADGPNAAPHLEYHFSTGSSWPCDPWPFLVGIPPNRMVYRFAPYVDTAGTPIDTASITLVAGQAAENSAFTVTPNPASNMISINHKGIQDGVVTLSDMAGKVIWRKVLATTNNIDVSDLATGTYLVRLVAPNHKVYATKFLKK